MWKLLLKHNTLLNIHGQQILVQIVRFILISLNTNWIKVYELSSKCLTLYETPIFLL